MGDYYILHDHDPDLKQKGAIHLQTDPLEIAEYNTIGWGVFSAVNKFKAGKRVKDNLINLNAFYVDIDLDSKNIQMEKIKRQLIPSKIVETRNGYHIYWYIRHDEFTADEYSPFLKERIIPYFDGDPRASDICRILRVPGFYHMKDPQNPFLIECHRDQNGSFSRKILERMFPVHPSISLMKEKTQVAKREFHSLGNDFFDQIYNLDQEQILLQLSGTNYINGDVIQFKNVSGGNKNIWVNGKCTSSWIDREKKIGSRDMGGPTILQWLCWYGHSKKTAIDIVKKEIFNG